MILKNKVASLRDIYTEYPPGFWTLILGSFIDRLGGALLYPFFALYITQKFRIGMTEVGLLMGVFSLSSIVGSTIGGALADRIGRKAMIIFGLITSALTSLSMGLSNSIELLFILAVFVGVFADAGGPAQQAVVSDLLPEKKRIHGFGLLRVAVNLAVTVGPAIGGLLAGRSYLWLFICDAVSSLITAGIVFIFLPETKPADHSGTKTPSLLDAFRGYGLIARDSFFMAFMAATMLSVVVYVQMSSTLPVFLRDYHGVSTQGFGYIMSLNACMVVLFQFPISRRISRYRPMLLMAVGAVFYTIGYGMYGFVSSYGLFLAAMALITVGEMIGSPVSQALAASLAPEDMRGRYMAFFGYAWVLPFAVGPLLAGILMDHADARYVWYAALAVGAVSTAWFLALEKRHNAPEAMDLGGELPVSSH